MASKYYKDLFNGMADEDLINRVRAGLVPEAHTIACKELSSRGIKPPSTSEGDSQEQKPYLGDMVLLSTDLTPTEAHILASCLAASGIHAATGDTETVTANSLWAIALGGAKVRVPASQLSEAQDVLKAFLAGEFDLSDDHDVGEA